MSFADDMLVRLNDLSQTVLEHTNSGNFTITLPEPAFFALLASCPLRVGTVSKSTAELQLNTSYGEVTVKRAPKPR